MNKQKTLSPTNDWNDDEWETCRKWLSGVLKTNQVTITFIKKDGTERVMNCTLQPELLPVVEIVEGKTPKKQSENTMSVYDIDSKGWRSFTLKSLKRIQFSL